MSDTCAPYEAKMKKSVEVMKHDFTTIRAGRANPALLERVSIDYFGVPTPVHQVASIASPEPRLLTITPWDSSVLPLVEKAIQAADLGINPQNDGKMIRLTFPQLTEERRKDLIKGMKKGGEDTKVAIRNIRRDGVEAFKKMQKAADMTEDDLKLAEKEIQDLTDKYCKEVDQEVVRKEKELSEI